MPNIVEANKLVKLYPGSSVPAVRGITFTIQKGEIFGFLGPNGAGKTTMISMLSCLLKPTEGNATIAGFDLISQSSKVKRQIGLVPQDLALYPTLSARDNLLFFGRIYGLKGSDLHQRVDDALMMVSLFERAGDAVETFSGGMKRRVNIAAGLIHKPQVLFLDEPTVGVDPQSRNFIFENVESLNQDGLTVLYTTHYMEEAQRLCDRVAIVDQGQIIALDTPKALIDSLGGGIIYLGVPPKLPGSLIEEVERLPNVQGVAHVNEKLEITAHHAQQAMVNVIKVFNEINISITSLEILEPNLETVFLHLTGKRLRN